MSHTDRELKRIVILYLQQTTSLKLYHASFKENARYETKILPRKMQY